MADPVNIEQIRMWALEQALGQGKTWRGTFMLACIFVTWARDGLTPLFGDAGQIDEEAWLASVLGNSPKGEADGEQD